MTNAIDGTSIRWVGAPEAGFKTLWDFQYIDLPALWAKHGTRGEGVNIAIIDSGVDSSHPAFQHLARVPRETFVEGSSSLVDGTGHGTWVAGKLAGLGVGIAPHCNIWSLKVFDADGLGDSAYAIKALNWAKANIPDLHLVNMSLGGLKPSEEERLVIDALVAQGTLVVAAMGNYGNSVPLYPAGFSGTIGVGAFTEGEVLADFSNWGDNVEVVAPGTACYSTYLGGRYRLLEGTSMATPIVTGLLALGWGWLIKALGPGLDLLKGKALLERALYETAKDLGPQGRDDHYGYGAVNGPKFMERVVAGTSSCSV